MKKYKIIFVCIFMSIIFILGVSAKAGTDYNLNYEEIIINDLVTINIDRDLSEQMQDLNRATFKTNFLISLMFRDSYDLVINKKNRIEINYKLEIEPYIERFKYLDYDNLKALYIVLTLDNKNTGIGSFVTDNESAIPINNNQFKIDLDINDVNKYYDLDIWWENSLGNMSDTGNIYYKSCKLYVEYNTEVNTLNDVGSNFELLPLSDKKFLRINDVVKLSGLNAYKIIYEKDDIYYGFDMQLDGDFDINLMQLKTNDGWNLSYTSDGNIRYLYIQPDLTKSPIPINWENNDVNNPTNLMVGCVIVNLNTMEYDVVKRIKYDTFIEKNNNVLTMLLFVREKIEFIYNIRVEYRYRYIYAFLFSGDWVYVDNYYAHDDAPLNVKIPWWVGYMSAFLFTDNLYSMDYIHYVDDVDIAYNKFLDYKDDIRFTDDVNKGDVTLYEINLGQYNQFGSTNVHISDYGILEMTYLYKGIVYKVFYPEDMDGMHHQPSYDNMFFDFVGFFKLGNIGDLASFFSHIVAYWKETIVFGLVLYMIVKIFRKRR